MGRSDTPGTLEHMVLLAIAGRTGDAQARDVYEILVEATGHDASVAAIHITLARMAEKGWVDVRSMAPEPGRGGKPRRWYRLSKAGADLLSGLRLGMDRLWREARAHPLVGGAE